MMATPGRILTLVGADGAGKSTQAKRLCSALNGSARYVYMGSNPSAFTHTLPTTKAWVRIKGAMGGAIHHSGPPEERSTRRPESAIARGAQHLKSLAVLGLRVSEDLYRLLVAARYAHTGHTVIMDRHPYPDYYTRRVRDTGAWLRWGDRIHGFLLRHVYPRPSNLVILDAPAEVLHARKPEGSLAALEARRREYLDMIGTCPGASVTVIDASRPEESVFRDLLRLADARAPLSGHGPRPHLSHALALLAVPLLIACDNPSPNDVVPPDAPGIVTVTVMTYNIFHDGADPGRGILPWSERRDAVVAMIRGRSPDVVGLQEAEVWQVEWLLDEMPEYEAVARGPYADAGVLDAETVAVLFQRERFALQESGHFWYSESPDQPGSYGSAAFGGTAFPRMATWVRLVERDTPQESGFYVFNTHFVADEHADDAQLARFKSAELLAERIADRAHRDAPFLVTGDLNTGPGSWPLRYLLGSRCESGEPCSAPEADLRMIDAWEASNPGDTESGTRCNAETGADGTRVDHVLVWDPPTEADTLPDVLTADILAAATGCPSDHRPVASRIALPVP